MSGNGILVETVVLPDPTYQKLSDDKFRQLPANISFSYEPDLNPLRTLSTTDAPNRDIIALLYVPTLSPDSTCNASAHIPANVTRRHNLPPSFSLIAFAPWLTPQCTLDFLYAASHDAEIEAFVFYLPNNSTEVPPTANSPVWSLGDGGGWKSSNKYPVYALPGRDGAEIMNALNNYSGNLTSVPHGGELASFYHPSDFVRLAVEIDTGTHSLRPSLWVFMLVVLAILFLTVITATCTMRWLQRKRRNQLRQRVVNGEIDLEALGVKRLAVPPDLLEKMPVFVYTLPPSTHDTASLPSNHPTSPTRESDIPESKHTPVVPASAFVPPTHVTFSTLANSTSLIHQPTCAICLDDFIPSATPVRQLPCGHIYHPSCIDPFLRGNSSLCPLCKKSVLPKGYCPKDITNLMVRRARILEDRNARQGVVVDNVNGNNPTGPAPTAPSTISAVTNNTNVSVRTGLGRGWGLADALPELLSVSSQRTWRNQSDGPPPSSGSQLSSSLPMTQSRASNTASPGSLVTVSHQPAGNTARTDDGNRFSMPGMDPPPYSSPTLQTHPHTLSLSATVMEPIAIDDAGTSKRARMRERARALLSSRAADATVDTNAPNGEAQRDAALDTESKGIFGRFKR